MRRLAVSVTDVKIEPVNVASEPEKLTRHVIAAQVQCFMLIPFLYRYIITSAYDYISSTLFIKTIGLHLIIINLYVSP